MTLKTLQEAPAAGAQVKVSSCAGYPSTTGGLHLASRIHGERTTESAGNWGGSPIERASEYCELNPTTASRRPAPMGKTLDEPPFDLGLTGVGGVK